MKERFTEEKIIGFLKQAESGVAIKELCRKHGFSDAAFYTWRRKFGGMEVADAKRRIGQRVALMGGVNTLTLADGTPDDVRQEAIRKCREGGPHGYILAAGDMVPPQTPFANLLALVEVARKSLWREESNVMRQTSCVMSHASNVST